MKYLFWSLTLVLGLQSFPASASPVYPWDYYRCSPIKQDDGKKIGALCGKYNSTFQVTEIAVYYFGALTWTEQDYSYFYVNLSINNSPFFARKGLKKTTFGDGQNLPEKEVYYASYIMTHNFQSNSEYPEGKPFAIYFQAEEKVPKHSPPFSYDNNFARNYSGKVPPVNF